MFELPLTAEHIDALIKLSQSHYDARCKMASNVALLGGDGFLAKWQRLYENDQWYRNQLTEEDITPDPFTVGASFDELDISMKILEMCDMLGDVELVALCRAMARSFAGAAFVANNKYHEWQTTYTDKRI